MLVAIIVLTIISGINLGSSIYLFIKLKEMNSFVAVLTMAVVDNPNTTHIVKDNDNIYDISFPNKEGF